MRNMNQHESHRGTSLLMDAQSVVVAVVYLVKGKSQLDIAM